MGSLLPSRKNAVGEAGVEGGDASFGGQVHFEVISIAAEVETVGMNDVSGGVDKITSRKWKTGEPRDLSDI